MNEKARKLGLEHTNFTSPHGLDDEMHYTTAYELALLTDYALKNDIFKNIVKTKIITIYINGYPREISNTNELLDRIEGVYGVKTGFTFEAGRCLVSSCNRKNMDIIIVVLGADIKKQRTLDSINLINYVYDNFEYIDLKKYVYEEFDKYIEFYKKNVILNKTQMIPELYINEDDKFVFPLNTNKIQTLNTKFYSLNMVSDKIKKGNTLGELEIHYNDGILYKYKIITRNTIFRNSWMYYFVEIIKKCKKIDVF